MGKVQQRAGGGKVTVEGLAAEVVQKGSVVTVKQGSKTVQQLTGTLDRPIFVSAAYQSGTGLVAFADGVYISGSRVFLRDCTVRYSVYWTGHPYWNVSWSVGSASGSRPADNSTSSREWNGTVNVSAGQSAALSTSILGGGYTNGGAYLTVWLA